MGETYATLHCEEKVTSRVFTTQQVDKNDMPIKYVVKDLENKLLGHIVFSDKDHDGILNDDLLEILIDRLTKQQLGQYQTRDNALALTRVQEALLWLQKKDKK